MPDIAVRQYYTWYDFKRDLEKKLGRFINVDTWLQIKPKKALPWNSDDLNSAVSDFAEKRALFDFRSMVN